MHVIVIGCGKVGSKLAIALSEEGHDVVIVDNDSSNFKMLGASFRGITVTGVPIDQDVLKQAGIEDSDVVAAVTPDDNVNIMVCQVAKEIFKIPRVIARIYNPDREHVFHEFGLETICPTDITVDVIRSKILTENCVSKHNIANSEVRFSYVKVTKGNEKKALEAFNKRESALIFGVLKNGNLFMANSNIKLEIGDVIIIAEKSY
jgi:trk system potassium uptake protein TrkA